MTIVCGDSHTSTHGAFGALAFGIGTSEVEHVLATQTLVQRRPKTMLVDYRGELGPGCTAKDMILGTIAQIGTDGGAGHVIEYAGEAVRGLSMEGRMTIANMSIEAGARAGMIAPDDTTFAYLEGRPGVPEDYDAAVAGWRELTSDRRAPPSTARSRSTSPHSRPRSRGARIPARWCRSRARFPAPADEVDERALAYMDLRPGHAGRGDPHRPGVPRLLHQWPTRGPAGGGRIVRGRGRRRRPGDGRAGLDAG